MTEKELRRLGRRELIEIIAAMKRTEVDLRSKLEKAEEHLANRTIQIANAGSIAEAALSLHGVFEAAQAAADTYLQSIYGVNVDIDRCRAQEETERAELLHSAELEAIARLQAADEQCAQKLAAADAEIREKWNVFRDSVQNVLQSHPELVKYLRENSEKD